VVTPLLNLVLFWLRQNRYFQKLGVNDLGTPGALKNDGLDFQNDALEDFSPARHFLWRRGHTAFVFGLFQLPWVVVRVTRHRACRLGLPKLSDRDQADFSDHIPY
jgi:hypothetical protein